MQYFLKVVKDNYANFSGRARRKEYWMFTLISVIISVALSLLDVAVGLVDSFGGQGFGISTLYSLAILVPSLAVVVRRLHDVGKSGWWYLIVLTGIGAFYILYLLVSDSEQETNKWGASPKYGGGEDDLSQHLVD